MIIDTHAHLDQKGLIEQLDTVLGRAREAGVHEVICIGIDLESCRRTLALVTEPSSDRPDVKLHAALGLHPNEPAESEATFEELAALFEDASEIVAVGETGLDHYWDKCPRDVQEVRFRNHLELARTTGLPAILHCRDAYDDVIRVLKDEDFRHGVVHCFTGDAAQAETLLEHGFHLSFAGNLTYPKAENLREVAAIVPIDRLLLETDSPYLAPVPKRGKKPNEPSYVVHTAEVLATCKEVSFEEVCEQATANARRLFRI